MHTITRLITGTMASLAVAASLMMGGGSPAEASPDATTSPPLSATSTAAEAGAVNYVNGRMGDTGDDGYCQRLVREAYASAGVDITATATDNSSAVAFWETTSLAKHEGPTTDVPAGALVFWGATPTNDAGHVALAEGGDAAASTEERDNVGVHVFSIGARNSAGYQMLGWVMPA